MREDTLNIAISGVSYIGVHLNVVLTFPSTMSCAWSKPMSVLNVVSANIDYFTLYKMQRNIIVSK